MIRLMTHCAISSTLLIPVDAKKLLLTTLVYPILSNSNLPKWGPVLGIYWDPIEKRKY